jgi:hypothetical protein
VLRNVVVGGGVEGNKMATIMNEILEEDVGITNLFITL